MRLGHARGHRSHAHLGHQLHRNARLRIHVLQIVNQLRQIFDRVNVVMRRRRNQPHARDRMAHPRDHLVHFVARQLAALAGLRALRHLDLQFVGVHQVIRGHAEPRARHLLDRAARQSPFGRAETRLVLAAFAGIAILPADAVHRDGQRFVRLFARSSRNDIAPVANRLTISFAGSTSSIGTGFAAVLNSISPRSVHSCRVLLVDQVGVFLEGREALRAAPRAAASVPSADCTDDTRRARGY